MKKLILLFLIICVVSKAQWIQIYNGNYNSVNFFDANTGMACGNNGVIIKTTNGGQNWVTLNTGINQNLTVIKYLSSNIVICAGDYQIIIRSTNNGQTWSTVYNPSSIPHNMRKIFSWGSMQAMIYSYCYYLTYIYNGLYKTNDFGATWQTQFIENTGVRTVHFINMNTGWSYYFFSTSPPNYENRVGKTTDGGTTWSVLYSEYGSANNPYNIYFYDGNFGLKENTFGMQRTTNGGYSWNVINIYQTAYRYYIFFLNRQTGWIVAWNSIRSTTDGSLNWSIQQSPVNSGLSDVFFIDSNTGWIAAGTGGILKTTNGGISGISVISTNIPDNYSLSQNYPNPFNPNTKIQFSIPPLEGARERIVRLIIYDILGREIQILLNEQLSPGIYEVEFDGSNYPSGIYYYKLITENYTETRKMVLIK